MARRKAHHDRAIRYAPLIIASLHGALGRGSLLSTSADGTTRKVSNKAGTAMAVPFTGISHREEYRPVGLPSVVCRAQIADARASPILP